MKLFLLLIICLAIGSAGYSQEKLSSVRGMIIDSASGETLEQASVSLIRRADLVVLKQLLSGKNGFEFRRVAAGDYLLSVSFIGYRPDTIRLTVGAADSLYNTGKIQLVKLTANLMEVVVRSVIPPVIVKNDTLVYNTNTVKTQPNATIEDLIKKLPGMDVDKDGNITLHGQKVEKIYVDGKEFFLNDPKLATQNLTADMVDAIEAFDNQSDKAKFSGIKEMNVNKAINLRLKKDKKKGFSGNASARAGNHNIYSGSATATYFKGDRWVFGRGNANYTNYNANDAKNANGSANGNANEANGTGLKQSGNNEGLNYRDNIGKKTQVVANYGSGQSRIESGQLYKRETFLGDSSLLQNKNSFNDNRSQSRNFNINLTYTIDSLNSIVYTPSISWQQNETMNSDSSFIESEKNGNNYLINEGKTMNHLSSKGSTINNTIAWRRRFRKKGRSFYGVFSQGHQQQTQQGDLYSRFYDNGGATVQNQTIDQHYDQKNHGNNYGLNIYYTEPIKANQVIDLGINLNTSSNQSGKQAFNYDSSTHKYDQEDTLTTNQFTNSNQQENFSIGYNYLGKKVQCQLGVSVLYTSLKNESDNHNYTTIEQHLINWSPRASAFYRLAAQKNLRIQYNGNSTAPTTEMLQPIPDLSNPFLVKLGNPNLKQQFQHNLNMGYNSASSKTFRNLSLQLGSNLTMNKIVQSSTISAAGIQQLMFVNVNGVYAVNGDLNYGFALNKTKNGGGEIATTLQYGHDINFVNGERNTRQSFVAGQRFRLNYHADDKLYAGVSAGVNYNRSNYSIGNNLNTELVSQNYAANITYMLPLGIRVSSDFTVLVDGKQGNLPGRTIATWNASVFRFIFRNNKGEIRLSGFDLLNRNKGFSQTTGDNYIETR
ncbi:MAG: outer membrane beta-barrel protein, partial [Bacteroidota bacterium]|nr:outer membrane beta-barrel protein [Bacteroidota bacterium]